jgi:peptidoglycan/LPS O-acetylase OafA/YrhL
VSDEPKPSGGDGSIFRIAGLGSALAFGAMAASLFALDHGPSGFSFRLTTSAVIAFVLAAAAGWYYWKLVARMASEKSSAPRRKKFIVFSVGLVLLGVTGFLYPMKFIPPEKRHDVFIGLALAFCVLSGVALVMWKVIKFLDSDLKKSEHEDQPPR